MGNTAIACQISIPTLRRGWPTLPSMRGRRGGVITADEDSMPHPEGVRLATSREQGAQHHSYEVQPQQSVSTDEGRAPRRAGAPVIDSASGSWACRQLPTSPDPIAGLPCM